MNTPDQEDFVLIANLQIAKPITVSYEPKEDITAWELAKLIPLFQPHQYITEDTLAGLGSAARHLQRH